MNEYTTLDVEKIDGFLLLADILPPRSRTKTLQVSLVGETEEEAAQKLKNLLSLDPQLRLKKASVCVCEIVDKKSNRFRVGIFGGLANMRNITKNFV